MFIQVLKFFRVSNDDFGFSEKKVCDTDIIPLASLSQTNKSPNVKKNSRYKRQLSAISGNDIEPYTGFEIKMMAPKVGRGRMFVNTF